jgi:putative ABC transport system substrate-binding protein
MDRRSFIARVAGVIPAAPFAVRAQPSTSPEIGFLSIGSPAQWGPLLAAFRIGLKDAGYVEGRNVRIEFRWAGGRDDQLPILAADLVQRKIGVLVATGGPGPALAAKTTTSTIPIVFTLGADPIKLGLAASLGRPGGNVTGVTFITGQLNGKRIELLHELVPKASVIALLINPDNPNAGAVAKEAEEAARSLGRKVQVLLARSEQEIEAAFVALGKLRTGALFVESDGFFYNRRERVVELAARHAVPASFELREYVAAGGLMSCGTSLSEVYRSAGLYAGKVLAGVKPADLPILQPTKIDLVINLRTAKALGLPIPAPLLVRADELVQ